MVRAGGIVMAAGGLLAKAALGLITLAILIRWDTPPSEPAATATSRPGDPEESATTVTLRVPDGALAKHLIAVDASGRELAVLTYWKFGGVTVVSRRVDGAGVCCHLETDGSARMLVEGTTRAAQIDADPNGTTRVTHQPAGFRVDRPLAIETLTPTGSSRDPDPRSDQAADHEKSPPPGLDAHASDRDNTIQALSPRTISSRIRDEGCEASWRVVNGRGPEHACQLAGAPPRPAG
jgi:hypothetical protein